MKKMKIGWILGLCMIMSFSLLTACSKASLNEGFDEGQVKLAAEEVIDLVNKEDSEKILAMSSDEMRSALSEEVLASIYKDMEGAGDFKAIKSQSIGGHKDKDSEEEFAIASVLAEYENKNYTFTITFTKDMKLAGIFYK
nr:DUF3887 domain-containing protein [Tissierella sp.]